MTFEINYTTTTDYADAFPNGGPVATALYARVSDTKGGIQQSIADQLHQCRNYAEHHGAAIHPDYVIGDDGEDSKNSTGPVFRNCSTARGAAKSRASWSRCKNAWRAAAKSSSRSTTSATPDWSSVASANR
jgi:hypothetical protein